MSKFSDISKSITMIGQLGLSIIMPTLICIFVCWFITSKTNVGSWIYIVGFFFGIGSSFMTAYKFYQQEVHKLKKNKKKKVSFNSHL